LLDVIDPELFPFFMHSDLFMNRAVDISVGSLSPTINWGTLKHQEFLIPPLELQECYSKLFWSSNRLIENELDIIEKKQVLKHCLQKKYFQSFENKKSVLVGDVAKLTAGGTPSTQVSEYWKNGTVLWFSSGEVHKKRVFSTEKKITESALKNSSAKLIPIHSCLIALAGQGKTKGTVAISEVELSTNQSVAAIMPDESKIEPYYLYHNLDSRYHDFRHITGKQNSRTGLNLKILKEFRIAFHDKKERGTIQNIFNQLDESIAVARKKVESSQSLQKILVNKVF